MKLSNEFEILITAIAPDQKILTTITPELAKELLERGQEDRRPLNENKVKEYALMIQEGLFTEEKTLIIIDVNSGQLIDGQHILSGYIVSGLSGLKFNILFVKDPYL